MVHNLVQLNQSKTDYDFCPTRGCSDINTYLGPWSAYCYGQKINLGVVFDPD